jgi:hypothetical protein
MVAPVQLVTPTQGRDISDRNIAPVVLDGNWTLVSYERDGQAVAGSANTQVKVANNMVTCNGPTAADTKTMKFEFGPQGTIRVTDAKEGGTWAKAKTGVFVLTNDYLCVCLHDDQMQANGQFQGNGQIQVNGERRSLKVDETFSDKPRGKSHCSMVFKRTSATTTP